MRQWVISNANIHHGTKPPNGHTLPVWIGDKGRLRSSSKMRFSPAVKSTGAYVCLFAGPGAVPPLLGLWLKAGGFSPAQIGLFIALPLLARVILGPVIGVWAGRFSDPRGPLIILCVVAATASFALARANGFGQTLSAWSILCLSFGACTPLLDAATLRASIDGHFAFAAPRSVASFAFIIAGLGLGLLSAHAGLGVVPLWSGMGAVAATVWIGAGGAWTGKSPAPCASPSTRLTTPGHRSSPALLLGVMASAGLIEVSHGFNAMAMLGWQARGLDAAWCSLLWQTGPVADVVLLAILSRYPINPSALLVLGGAAAVIRWVGFATAPSLAVLFLLQTLHALSFTATYIGTVQLIDEAVRSNRSVILQTVNWSLVTGLYAGLGVIGSGVLYERMGISGYWIMCIPAGLGLVIALILYRRSRHADGLRDAGCDGLTKIPAL